MGGRKLLAVLLLAALLCAGAGCGGKVGGYRVVDTYYTDSSYLVAFRQGDALEDYVVAALQVLAASDNLRASSQRWFGEDLVCLRGDEDALSALEPPAGRTLVVGADMENVPMSYTDGVQYYGFDMETAANVCGLLGWSLEIFPIDVEEMDVQLASGNIDCAFGIPSNMAVSGFDYSPSYITNHYLLVTRQTSLRSRSALKGKVLGVLISDADVLQTDEKFLSRLDHVLYENSNDGLFHSLDNDLVDAILVSSTTAAYYMLGSR